MNWQDRLAIIRDAEREIAAPIRARIRAEADRTLLFGLRFEALVERLLDSAAVLRAAVRPGWTRSAPIPAPRWPPDGPQTPWNCRCVPVAVE